MVEVRKVALLALIYRTGHINRWCGRDDIAIDQEVCPGELSWLAMFAAQLPEADWAILRQLDAPADFERVARRIDPLRAEALLHAAPPKGAYPAGRWGAPYRERWGRVRSRMRLFEQEGYAASRDELDAVAAQAWMAATGDSFVQYLDRWGEP